MKKVTTILMTVACVALTLGLTGCCNDHPLKGDRAKSLVKKELARTYANEKTMAFPVGYYECNDDETRYKLRQLAANGLITYSCDRVPKTERVRKSRRVQRTVYGYAYYDTQYYYDTEDVTTYFVNVALTDKGQKLVVEEREAKPTPEEKELRLDFEPDLTKYPEAAVDREEFPSSAAAGADDFEVSDDVDVEEAEEEHNFEDEFQPEEPMVDGEAEVPDAYLAAKSKENKETVHLKAFDLKVVKVRNIRQNNANVPTAEAEVIVEATNVTPVGRIFGDVFDGQRDLLDEVHFVYFQDKGWRLTGIDD